MDSARRPVQGREQSSGALGLVKDLLHRRVFLDAKKSPGQIDIKPDVGPAAGKTLKGIYKIEKDTLTICHVGQIFEGWEKKDRPAEFDVKKRSDVVILTLVRKKP